jgi:hypothetical protein
MNAETTRCQSGLREFIGYSALAFTCIIGANWATGIGADSAAAPWIAWPTIVGMPIALGAAIGALFGRPGIGAWFGIAMLFLPAVGSPWWILPALSVFIIACTVSAIVWKRTAIRRRQNRLASSDPVHVRLVLFAWLLVALGMLCMMGPVVWYKVCEAWFQPAPDWVMNEIGFGLHLASQVLLAFAFGLAVLACRRRRLPYR